MATKVNDKAYKVGFHREIGDESNPTFAIVIGGTSNALHLVDPLNAGTDYNVSADTTPSLYIHGSAAAPTEYVKIYTDQTDGFFKVVGGNAVLSVPTSGDITLQVNAVDEYVFTATSLDLGTNTLAGTTLSINAAGTAIKMANASSWAALGTGTVTTGVIGPAEIGSVSVKRWLKLIENAGTAVYWIPAYAP